ncbi:MAG TPA: class I SAM-dependent methyltransferase [Egibacteraceae bacterium]|nr:class I SAM-dependent methyltransferase [Egibacteraceae bacterium]
MPDCRSCGTPLVHTVVDLGHTPLANSYVEPEAAGEPDVRYPLHARVCHRCLLVQVDDVVPPEEIFTDYAYFSSYSDSWVEHARRFAEHARRRLSLGPDSLVVEVASNDGYLLRHFLAAGTRVLGVEPAVNVAKAAESAGVPTEVRFFGEATARDLAHRGMAADLLVGNNVLAHVPDLNDFVRGLRILLKPAGTISMEFPHLLHLIEQVQFDTIYHEHFSYLSLLAVEAAFARHGLRVWEVEELPTHGGSLRILACHAHDPRPDGPGLDRVRAREARAGLGSLDTYAGFADRVAACCQELRGFLDTAAHAGKHVAAYGAAAKGNTLLNCCGIGTDRVGYVVDRSPHKQGRLLPGSRLPICAPERIAETRPDYLLVLPWNLVDEITEQMAEIREWGGRFVVAIPSTRVLS